MKPLLEARNVSKVFGGGLFSKSETIAVRDASFVISDDHPSITAIAGESGSGKTTLARMLLGIVQPSDGQIFYKEKDLEKISGRERKTFRREVQAVFQDPFEVYNPFYKVDHVLESPVSKFYGNASKTEATEMINDALRAVGLRPEETLGRYPHQLSGGQRQRVMVARALLLRPRIIVADEPVSMVDASLRATILESLLNVHRQFSISIVYITHDLTTAYQLCEKILMMYRGFVVEAGDVDLVIKDPQHPYTQLLVDSIPLPNPKLQWGQKEILRATPSENGDEDSGCQFANRCPFVMPKCREQTPPYFGANPQRAVACFLYEDAPIVDLSAVLATETSVAIPPSAPDDLSAN